jgi:hypothetical protein
MTVIRVVISCILFAAANMANAGVDGGAPNTAHASCALAPCWELKDLVSRKTIGTTKDLIDAKVGPAVRIEKGLYQYQFGGCTVEVGYTDYAVSYFSADLYEYVYEYVEAPGQEAKRRSCNFSVKALFNADESLSLPENAALTVADAMPLTGESEGWTPTLSIASACIDCGNYSEPYLQFKRQGAHSEQFITSFFTTYFDPVDYSGDEGYEIHQKFKETMRAYIGPDAESGVEVEPLCERDIYPDIKNILPRSSITAVGLGVGSRSWKNALHCE